MREVKFGQITLHTNGFNGEIYGLVVGDRNMPDIMGHTQNWSDERLMEILKLIPDGGDNEAANEGMHSAKATRFTEVDFEKIAESLRYLQAGIDAAVSYKDSKGFYNDFYNAMSYSQNLVSTGLHPMSKRSHSNLDIEAEGETTITSKKGRPYKVSIPDTIENGLCHDSNYHLELWLPEEEPRSKMHNFVVSRNWGPELRLETKYLKVISRDSSGNETERSEVGHYDMILKGTNASAYVNSEDFLFKTFNIWWDTRYAKQLCQGIVNGLDAYFGRK